MEALTAKGGDTGLELFLQTVAVWCSQTAQDTLDLCGRLTRLLE